jgi:hypothetical protein
MERIICCREFRINAGSKGYALAREKFDSETNAERLAKALWSLVG